MFVASFERKGSIMFNTIKAVAVASLFAAALAASTVAQADDHYPPQGSELLATGTSTLSEGFKSGPHQSSDIYLEVDFTKTFGITPDVVHYSFVAHGVTVSDCEVAPVVNGKAALGGQGFTGDLYIGLCGEGIVLPEQNKAYTWSVYSIAH